ncbi:MULTISPECIES: hypothetical protein [Spirosoma]|uniref:Uncharacterized protein n=1 Tax=Spirosoma sordidisoli TaxID=2502893 RepID=A0A4Q2UQ83_9BACT|nr:MULTISPECIES: hypothetical protein [Spirosoma]RYC71566.1 hypothetical protein EQG79_05350 [Spirosoma sordidisoli]
MTRIQLDTQPDKYLISIDRSAVDRQWLVQLIERLRLEELAGQFNFGEDVEALGEQIKADWWAKNKSRFINE